MPDNFSVQTWRVQTGRHRLSYRVDDEVRHVKWTGPGPLTIPPGGARQAICQTTVKESYSPGVLVIDAPNTLPARVALSPGVLLSVDLNRGSIPILL